MQDRTCKPGPHYSAIGGAVGLAISNRDGQGEMEVQYLGSRYD